MGFLQYRDANPLDTHKLEGFPWLALNLQAQLDGLLDSRYQLVEGLSLCMAAAQRRNRSHVIAVFVPFNYYVELSHHSSILLQAFNKQPGVEGALPTQAIRRGPVLAVACGAELFYRNP